MEKNKTTCFSFFPGEGHATHPIYFDYLIFERKSCKNGFTKNILLRKWLNVLLQVKILCNVKAKKSLLLTFLVSKSLATGFALQNYCVCMSGSLFDDKFSHLKAFFRMVQNTTTRACYSKFELNMK